MWNFKAHSCGVSPYVNWFVLSLALSLTDVALGSAFVKEWVNAKVEAVWYCLITPVVIFISPVNLRVAT